LIRTRLWKSIQPVDSPAMSKLSWTEAASPTSLSH
jgi:hypothetical protein